MATEALYDAQGRIVARYQREVRDGRPMADFMVAKPGVPYSAIAAVAITAMPGWLAGTEDPRLGAAFEAAGARRRRRSHLMTLDLLAAPVPPPEPPSGLLLEPAGGITDDLVGASLAAYGPGHPDHYGSREAEAAELRRIVRGEEVGPLLRCSRIAWVGGRQVGAALVTDSGGEPPLGGPWLAQLFRDPDPRFGGLGRLLLTAAMHAAQADGLRTVGLAVSVTNPAVALYRDVGFARVRTMVTVELPDRARARP